MTNPTPAWIETINAFSTAVASIATVVLAVFAWVQIKVAKDDRIARDRAAARDHELRERAAVASLIAEQNRLSHLALRWGQDDLIARARDGDLHIDDLRPPDWGLVVGLLGEAGPAASFMASAAYGFLTDAITKARRLAWAGEMWRRKRTAIRSGANVTAEDLDPEWFKKWEGEAQLVSAEIKTKIGAAADGLNDAIKCAPHGRDPIDIQFEALSLTSEIAKRLQDSIPEAAR